MAQSVHLIGLMSGSSLDGLDIAWAEFSGEPPNLSWKLHAGSTVPLTFELKSTFQNVNVLSGLHLAELDAHFCKWMGDEVLSFIRKQGCNIDYVASHGHTLYHQPSNRYTVQLGNGGYLAAKTGIDTISDFRTTDVASGGQGAPFAPIADLHLFSKYPVSMNLGGIANITSISGDTPLAYDVCACNQVLNYLASTLGFTYDEDGKLASAGRVDPALLSNLANIDYYHKLPPKSLDNTWVTQTYFPLFDAAQISVNDKLATMVHHIANQVHGSLLGFDLNGGEMLVTGGGAYNRALVSAIRKQIQIDGFDVVLPSTDIIDYKEAILMAYMGYLRIMNIPNVLPSVTGATKATISGAIYKGL